MLTNRLGSTDLQVSRICFGTWSYGGDWSTPDLAAGRQAIRRARDLGINFFDTAQAYGFGAAEGLLADALAPELRESRHDVVIATKGGLREEGDRHVRDASPDWLRHGLDQSLRALGTDYVDLYLLHWPDPNVPFESVAEVFDEFVAAGKARYVGVSNFTADQAAQLHRLRPLDAVQPPFHLFRREAETEMLPFCDSNGIGVFVYGSLAHGLITGRFGSQPTFPPDDWRAKSSIFKGEAFATNSSIVQKLDDFARGRGISVAQLAIAWNLAHRSIDSAIVGARSAPQIEATAPAGDIVLSEGDMSSIASLTSGFVPVGGAAPGAIW